MALRYYEPLEEKNRVKVLDAKGDFLGYVRFDKLSKQAKVGCICYYVSKGLSLSEVATGKGWRPSEQTFFIWLRNSKTLKSMYKKAKDMRVSMLLEQLIEAQREGDKDKVAILSLTLKSIEQKIIKNILPPPIKIERSDWKHAFKKRYNMNIPQKEDLDKGIDKIKARVEGNPLVAQPEKRVPTFQELKDDLMEE